MSTYGILVMLPTFDGLSLMMQHVVFLSAVMGTERRMTLMSLHVILLSEPCCIQPGNVVVVSVGPIAVGLFFFKRLRMRSHI